jgi:ectoine hydroxylase-related dioxygenase (phytanoyl-CoA dioxygenase family)
MKVRFGHREMEFPSPELSELNDSNQLLGDAAALRQRLQRDGFLFLRGLIDREAVTEARTTIMQYMSEQQALVPNEPVLEGVMPSGGKSVPMMGHKGITSVPQVRRVLAAPELFTIFEQVFDGPALTFDYKWLRAVGNEQYTSAHYDIVYMGRGSARLHTTWIPLGDFNVQQGTLAMVAGSHDAPSYEKLRQTYGKMDVDRDLVEGWFTKEPMEITEKFGGQWATANFQMGDVMIFGMYMMHASTTNLTNRFRLSCDVRFQPQTDEVDERWVGDQPMGHYAYCKEPVQTKSMQTARAEWGL